MLYVTTRVQGDAFTAHRVLTADRGPEGGFYLPMRMPVISEDEWKKFSQRSMGDNIADILNRLFPGRIDGWSVEFAIGRYPVNLVDLSGKVTVAETWHNPEGTFACLEKNIYDLLTGKRIDHTVTDWIRIAARIAVLFGIFGELAASGKVRENLDVAVPCGDFAMVMAAWYARDWGLPVGTILCCCNENSAVWNLLNHGELKTDGITQQTDLPKCDYAVPTHLERLIFSVLGRCEARKFCNACREGRAYCVTRGQMQQLRRGISAEVVSGQRISSMLSAIRSTDNYVADPYTALCYSGLTDYRSRSGNGKPVLIIAEESPAVSMDFISESLGISPGELMEYLEVF